MNKKSWDALPADLQEILRVAMRAVAADMYAQSYHLSSENLAVLAKDFPNVVIKTFPKPVIDAMRAANDELLAERAAADPLAREIIESQAAYLGKVRQWTAVSDQAYLDSLSD